MMRGIQMYQKHPFNPVAPPTQTIWQSDSIALKRPAISDEVQETKEHSLLMIPSLINKAHILNLSDTHSMLSWFNKRGIKTYLLDWGELNKTQEKDIDIAKLVQTKLCAAIRKTSEIEGKPVDVLGYCMGGTLALSGYNFASDHIRRMILLASPWDFHTTPSYLARNVRIWSPAVLPVINERGYLPAEWVQALFASLDPNGSAQKFIKFASMDQNSPEAKLFIAVEDWLNDGIDLPKNIAHECIQDWFIDNKLAQAQYTIANQSINVEEISAKILMLASQSDRLVTFDCAANIQKNLKSASLDTIKLDCGHIGLIVGRDAIKTVWNPILKWIQE